MPKKKAIDAKALVKAVENGGTQPDIMKKFGFKTGLQLKNAYMNALIENGKIIGIKGGRAKGKGRAKKAKLLHVGKRGSIVISKELVESLGIAADQKFTIRKTKAGLALKVSK